MVRVEQTGQPKAFFPRSAWLECLAEPLPLRMGMGSFDSAQDDTLLALEDDYGTQGRHWIATQS